MSTYELAEATGMPYALAERAMTKARHWDLVEYISEERASGGERYRYSASHGWEGTVAGWAERGLI